MKCYLFMLLLTLSFLGCKKKDLPTTVNGTPVFKFMGTIGSDSVKYEAGVSNMYMYSDYYKDNQNLMTLKSYFAKDNCSNCEPYLSFEIKDFQPSNSNALAGSILQLLKGGGTFNSYSLDSVLNSNNVEIFSFSPSNKSFGTTYNWDFGDGGTSTLMSPSYIFSSGGMKTVRLITQSGGLTDTIFNDINTDQNSSCRAQFDATIDSMMNTVTVHSFTPGFSYAWDFGDGSNGTGQTVAHTYSNFGIHTITLTATSPSCTSIFKGKINISSFTSTFSNYIYQTSETSAYNISPRINASAFIITYKKNGIEYVSYKNDSKMNQSANAIFTFTGIEPYQNNEKGQKTMKVSGTVDTYLYNKNNSADSLRIVSNQVVLALAYPE